MTNKPQTLFHQRGPATSFQRKHLQNYVDDKKTYLLHKRIFDVVFAFSFLLFIGIWLLPLIALLVWIDSRGPIFFVQKRVGKGGQTFKCIKFRTMVVNIEANDRQAEVNDVRITAIGRFLRNSSLDELPQFLNVISGSMSIVGPRPHMHSDCARFSDLVAEYEFRNFVKPGITGLAQVKGFRGPTLNFESIFHRYQYDAFYVRNCNFWLDMRIIRKTAVQTISFLVLKISGKEKTEKVDLIEEQEMITINAS